ncbi:MAG: 7-cyano-7-deazaguanine synthase [Elusimicrobiota bacterium]|nr:7-cyano-7-deazaguanine synthase [Elusimicrobiota bacterium]
MNKRIAVLFSGGVDSVAAALYYVKKGYEVHLLTFDNGAESGLEKSGKKADELKLEYPDNVKWEARDSRELFRKLAIRDMERDVRKYGNLICCGCKMAMLAEALIYCRKNKIRILADGFRKEQKYYPEQTRAYMDIAAEIAGDFGVKYEHPVYDMSLVRVKKFIESAGISAVPSQASCLFAFNRVSNDMIGEYTALKAKAVKKICERKIG